MKVLHVITGLGNGGAENTLFKVCKYDSKNKHIVISITSKGKYFHILKKYGRRSLLFKFKVLFYL